MENTKNSKAIRPSFSLALIAMSLIVGFLIVGIMFWKVDLHVLIILGIISTSVISVAIGYTWTQVQGAMTRSEERRVGKECRL